MPELVPMLALGTAMIITLVASSVQSTIGFGFALIAVPTCALVSPDLAPVPQLFLMWPLALMMAYRDRKAIRSKEIAWIFSGQIPGAGIGILLLMIAPRQSLDLMLAAIVLLAVVLLTARIKVPFGPPAQIAAGVLSGVMDLVSSMSGPPIVLLYRDRDAKDLRANAGTIFSIGLTITITTRLIAGHVHLRDLIIAACLAPPMILGFYLSRFLIPRINATRLRVLVLAFTTTSALILATRALW